MDTCTHSYKYTYSILLPTAPGRVNHQLQINTRWRGSYSLLAAVTKVAAHMVGLQERMKGPRYDCYGPWEFFK